MLSKSPIRDDGPAFSHIDADLATLNRRFPYTNADDKDKIGVLRTKTPTQRVESAFCLATPIELLRSASAKINVEFAASIGVSLSDTAI